MALKITCPSCGRVHPLGEPLPLPGSSRRCPCGQIMAINFPPQVLEQLRRGGVRFEQQAAQEAKPFPPTPAIDLVAGPRPSRVAAGQQPAPPAPSDPFTEEPTVAMRREPVVRPGPGMEGFEEWEPTAVDSRSPGERAASAPDPGPPPSLPPQLAPEPRPVAASPPGSPTKAASPPQARPAPPPQAQPAPPPQARPAPPPQAQPVPTPPAVRAAASPAAAPPPRPPASRAGGSKPPPSAPAPPRRKRSLFGRLVRVTLVLGLLGAVAAAALAAGAILYYRRDLPTLETLQDYQPPTVTVIYDRHERLLGEIYEKRRYVVPIEEIPQHVQEAFIASEDANFWHHGGVDPMGIARAIIRNALKGKKAQGASTITQQVARNFLLSSEKKYSRKIKEMILATRVEEAFSKDHILYLYLNQIYLGSGAYGVEAAARTYFDKHVQDLTLAEAAVLAGLPQRPSDYSPQNHWEKARARQLYVLGQMLDKGFIDQATYDSAKAEVVEISQRSNPFLEQAPYFTEHIRRHLVGTYGFNKVYNDGLVVHATCDLDLQKVAQQAVHDGVLTADNNVGWRGPAEQLPEAQIEARLAAQEQSLREAISHAHLRVAATDSPEGGFDPLPERSSLQVGERYDAVVLEVADKHAVVGIGASRVLVPRSWTEWAHTPNPERSYRYRAVPKLDEVLHRGDLVQVTVEADDAFETKPFKGYEDAGPGPFAAARLYQPPELEGAFLSYRLSDGAVLAMVGGYDFANSEYNRPIQARRQVGSTFKPIVYAAAIQSKLVTTGTLVQDAPVIFNVLDEKLWKPANYGDEYMGNITLRKALQLSRNVCTVRVLDRVGLDPVYELAGPSLRIGYQTPSCERTHIPVDEDCMGTKSPSPVDGMAWCEYCDPTSCPLVLAGGDNVCMDDPVTLDDGDYCHSCDENIRVCDWLPRERFREDERCIGQRKDADGTTLCRACDLSMGLGSSSLTMVELMRAYSAFATYGHLVEPHFIDSVVDLDGTVIESWEDPGGWPEVMEPAVAGIAHWLVRQVATGGTAARSNALGLHVAGKTGTTNDFFDAWFVGYNTDLIAAAWVGYDQPRSLGQSFTGGRTALPIWMDYMKVAAPKDQDHDFPSPTGVSWVPIDEATGRVAGGGLAMPMLPGTVPEGSSETLVGQKTSQDLLTTDF